MEPYAQTDKSGGKCTCTDTSMAWSIRFDRIIQVLLDFECHETLPHSRIHVVYLFIFLFFYIGCMSALCWKMLLPLV